MKLFCLLQPRILKEAIKALVLGPYTSKFPYKPHKPFEAFRGKPEFHEKDCTGCTACVNVCPSGALSFEDNLEAGNARRILLYRTDMCIFCGQCQANCLTQKGIMLSQEFDLATTEKREDLKHQIEKELALCDCCGEVIAPKDQIAWVSDRLGPLVFSNASLMLFYLGRMSLAQAGQKNPPARPAEAPAGSQGLRRQDRIKILCPKCRREAAAKS